MSTAAFPTSTQLPGLTWPIVRSEIWQTRQQDSVSGKRLNIADWSYPKYRWNLTYNFLRGYSPSLVELKTLEGFFGARKGGFDSFLYTDADDYTVTDSTIGTGDSTNQAFQLSRVFGSSIASYSTPILAPTTLTKLAVAGTTYGSTQFVLQGWETTAPGVVTFSSFAPSTGQAVTASFEYAFPVSFESDEMGFEQFVKQIWSAKAVSFLMLK